MKSFVVITHTKPPRKIHLGAFDAPTIVEASLGLKPDAQAGYDVQAHPEDGSYTILAQGATIARVITGKAFSYLKARGNFGGPVEPKAKGKRRRHLTPDHCPVHLAASMLSEQKWAKRRGLKAPKRFGNCALPSAEYAVKHHVPGRGPGGRDFSGDSRRGYYPDSDWTVKLKSGVVMSYWRRKLTAEPVAAPEVPHAERRIGRRIPWWPKNA